MLECGGYRAGERSDGMMIRWTESGDDFAIDPANREVTSAKGDSLGLSLNFRNSSLAASGWISLLVKSKV